MGNISFLFAKMDQAVTTHSQPTTFITNLLAMQVIAILVSLTQAHTRAHLCMRSSFFLRARTYRNTEHKGE